MKLKYRSHSIIHQPLISRFAQALFAAMLVIIITSIGRSQQHAPQAKPNEQGQPRTQPPNAPPANQNPPATSPSQNLPAPPVPFASPSLQSQSGAASPLALTDAVRQAITQASNFQQARLEESIAAEDVRQARLAFLPRLTSPLSFVYNSPALRSGAMRAEAFSFISANAITEYEALIGVTGDIDLSGRLRANLRRSVAVLEAAQAGSEVARRALIQVVNETYYGLALAAARRRSAELSLAAAEEFEKITELMFNAGEVAQVDLTRARLQIATRNDELEQARAAEIVAADSLRVFVGYDFNTPIATTDLTIAPPDVNELNSFAAGTISERPEFKQLDAQRRAAEQEVKASRAERLPQFSYSINGGSNTDSLRPSPLREHTGVLATVTVTIPIFDWGISKSRERQARLRAQTAELQRALALRNFSQQFYSARAQALSAARRVRILQAAVADAERNVQTSVARYRAGESPILEVTDAQTILATQRAALFQALFDYQMARARLAQAAGQ